MGYLLGVVVTIPVGDPMSALNRKEDGEHRHGDCDLASIMNDGVARLADRMVTFDPTYMSCLRRLIYKVSHQPTNK